MPITSNTNKNKKNARNSSGSILVLTLLLTSLMLFLAMYLLSFSLTDRTLSQSHARALRTYYLGEAGLNHAIFRLKNNDVYANNFETNAAWSENFSISNPFGVNGSYNVAITNTAVARADISATAFLSANGANARRVVKTQAFKAVGNTNPIGENAGYADGNIDISASVVAFHNGSAHSNNNFNINIGSSVSVDTALNTVNNLIVSGFSDLTVDGLNSDDPLAEIYAANYPKGPATAVDMPAIDFDSTDTSSYKNRADAVYSERDFEDLLENASSALYLSGPITYVTGDIILQGGRDLNINGVLVAERDIIIGKHLCWKWQCGASDIAINAVSGAPSGLLAKRKIKFDIFTGDISINGLIYANDQITVTAFTDVFNITGGLIARKLTITSVWQTLHIYRDDEIAAPTFNYTSFSPVISIEHWEEEY